MVGTFPEQRHVVGGVLDPLSQHDEPLRGVGQVCMGAPARRRLLQFARAEKLARLGRTPHPHWNLIPRPVAVHYGHYVITAIFQYSCVPVLTMD